MAGIDQLMADGRNIGENAKPAERIDLLEGADGVLGHRAAAGAMKPVAAGDEPAIDADILTLDPAGDIGLVAVEIVQFDVGDLVVADAAGVLAAVDEIPGDFGLPVDHDVSATGQLGQIDAMGIVLAGDGEAVMRKTFGMHPRASARLFQHFHGAFFKHSGAHARKHMVKARTLEDHRLDSDVVQQLAEQQSGRSGANDANLGGQRLHADFPIFSID